MIDRDQPKRAYRRPRLVDVAKLAGVSIGAASKAISDPDSVRPKTREAVQAAVEALGYIPSDAGRALVRRSTRMVGVVMPTMDHPVYAGFFHALQSTLAAHDYLTVALSNQFDPDRETVMIERLIRSSVDALVLVGSQHRERPIAMLRRAGIPFLYSWAAENAGATGAVGFSNREAMGRIVAHLAGNGHRRVGMINADPANNERAFWRLEGVKQAVAERGMELVAVAKAPLTMTGGLEAYRSIDPVGSGITALICGTDLLAAGAMHGARLDGIAVPQALSITGFDDIELAGFLNPTLTTVSVPVPELGRATGQAILDYLKTGLEPPSCILPTALVVRESTGPAPASASASVTSLASR